LIDRLLNFILFWWADPTFYPIVGPIVGYWMVGCLIWVGCLLFAFRNDPKPLPRRKGLLLLAPVIPLAGLFLPIVCLFTLSFAIAIASDLFDPHQLWLALPLFSIVWFVCRRSQSKWKNAISETLQPWLIGMAFVEIPFCL
jgi:hypothetical protein